MPDMGWGIKFLISTLHHCEAASSLILKIGKGAALSWMLGLSHVQSQCSAEHWDSGTGRYRSQYGSKLSQLHHGDWDGSSHRTRSVGTSADNQLIVRLSSSLRNSLITGSHHTGTFKKCASSPAAHVVSRCPKAWEPQDQGASWNLGLSGTAIRILRSPLWSKSTETFKNCVCSPAFYRKGPSGTGIARLLAAFATCSPSSLFSASGSRLSQSQCRC